MWVLAATETITQEPTWLEGQRQQASRSTNSVLQILDGGHYLQLDNAANVSGDPRGCAAWQALIA